LLDSGFDTAKKILEAGVDSIEQALTAPSRREELHDFGARPGGKYQKYPPRMVSEEEKRYWRKIAESIFKTIQDEFSDEDEESPATTPTSATEELGTSNIKDPEGE